MIGKKLGCQISFFHISKLFWLPIKLGRFKTHQKVYKYDQRFTKGFLGSVIVLFLHGKRKDKSENKCGNRFIRIRESNEEEICY